MAAETFKSILAEMLIISTIHLFFVSYLYSLFQILHCDRLKSFLFLNSHTVLSVDIKKNEKKKQE